MSTFAHLVAITTALALSVVSSIAHAQDTVEPAKKTTIGGDVVVGLPVGDISDGIGLGIGVLARAEYRLNPKLRVTGRVGYIQHLEKVDASFSQIPLLGGVKYFVSSGAQPMFLVGEAGLNILTGSVTVLGMTVSDSETKLGVNLGAGIELGKLDVRGSILIPSVGDVDDGVVISGTVGYNFASL